MKFDWQTNLAAIDTDTDTSAIVPDVYRSLYTNSDGKFILEDGVRKKLGDVTGLSSALDKERKNAKTAREMIAKWEALGETPEAIQTKLAELTEAATKGGQANFDKLKQDLEKGHLKALEVKDGEVGAMRKTVEKYLVENAAITAITDAKGVPELLLPHVQKNVKVIAEGDGYVVRVVDADGDPRGDGKGGFMTISHLVEEMKASTVFGRAFEATGGSGGGKPPGSGGKGAGGGRQTDPNKMSSMDKIAAGLAKGQMSRS